MPVGFAEPDDATAQTADMAVPGFRGIVLLDDDHDEASEPRADDDGGHVLPDGTTLAAEALDTVVIALDSEDEEPPAPQEIHDVEAVAHGPTECVCIDSSDDDESEHPIGIAEDSGEVDPMWRSLAIRCTQYVVLDLPGGKRKRGDFQDRISSSSAHAGYVIYTC